MTRSTRSPQAWIEVPTKNRKNHPPSQKQKKITDVQYVGSYGKFQALLTNLRHHNTKRHQLDNHSPQESNISKSTQHLSLPPNATPTEPLLAYCPNCKSPFYLQQRHRKDPHTQYHLCDFHIPNTNRLLSIATSFRNVFVTLLSDISDMRNYPNTDPTRALTANVVDQLHEKLADHESRIIDLTGKVDKLSEHVSSFSTEFTRELSSLRKTQLQTSNDLSSKLDLLITHISKQTAQNTDRTALESRTYGLPAKTTPNDSLPAPINSTTTRQPRGEAQNEEATERPWPNSKTPRTRKWHEFRRVSPSSVPQRSPLEATYFLSLNCGPTSELERCLFETVLS